MSAQSPDMQVVARMLEGQKTPTRSDERVKKLEALLVAKEQELKASCILRDMLLEKVMDLEKKLEAKELGIKGKRPGNTLQAQLEALSAGLVTAEERLEKLELERLEQLNKSPELTTTTIPPVPVPVTPYTSLKFNFHPRSTSVRTIASIDPEDDAYAMFSKPNNWEDICTPEDIMKFGLRHGSTTFMTPGGGKAPQLFDSPFESVPTVVIWLTSAQLNRERPWRVRCRADDVTLQGFTAVVEVWDGAELEAAGVAWVAYQKGKSEVWSGEGALEASGWICSLENEITGRQYFSFSRGARKTMAAVNEVVARYVRTSMSLNVALEESGDSGYWSLNCSGDSLITKVGFVSVILGSSS